MPETSGFQVQSALNVIGYSAPVIFMSGDADKADVIAAWREGAVDFVLKPFSGQEIRSAIDAHLERKSSHESAAESVMAKDVRLPITLRETQVLLLLGEGLRQHDVAKRLNITVRTVKMHRTSLKEKYNLNSAVDIARFYERHKESLERKLALAER
jgi:FixJ family two-component response regulator